MFLVVDNSRGAEFRQPCNFLQLCRETAVGTVLQQAKGWLQVVETTRSGMNRHGPTCETFATDGPLARLAESTQPDTRPYPRLEAAAAARAALCWRAILHASIPIPDDDDPSLVRIRDRNIDHLFSADFGSELTCFLTQFFPRHEGALKRRCRTFI